MKNKGIILSVVLLCAVAVFLFLVKKEGQEGSRAAVVGIEAPDVSLNDPSGKIYKLSELGGFVVFINFWATWCEPCRDEAPSVDKLYNRFKEERGFRMFTVLYKDDYQTAVDFQKKNNYAFPVLTDIDGKAAVSYGVTGVPETYIIDKKGVLKEKAIGPADWGSPEAINLITNLVRE